MSDICTDPNVLRVIHMIKDAIWIAKAVVPLILIGIVSIEMFKTVMNGDDKSVRETAQKFVRRVIAGVIIFFVPTIVNVIFGFVYETTGRSNDSFTSCIINAETEKIEEIENNQGCYVCSSNNKYKWSFEEPNEECSGGWVLDSSLEKKYCR